MSKASLCLVAALMLLRPLPGGAAEPMVPGLPFVAAKNAKNAGDDAGTAGASRYRDMHEYENDWPKVTVSPDGKTIYLTGLLPHGSYYKLLHATRIAPHAQTLYLSSPGGLTDEGRMIAGLVRRNGFSTYVEQQCASACTEIFVAGRERIAGPRARIGFHQSYLVSRNGDVVRENDSRAGMGGDAARPGNGGNRMMRNVYRQAGIAQTFIDKALATDPESMWFPGAHELLSAGVITRAAKAAELPPPPGYGQSRDAIVEAVGAQPLWRAFATAQPQIYSEAVDEIWREANTGISLNAAKWRGRQRLIDYAMAKQGVAPDALLDRFARLYGDQALWEKAHDYPGCQDTGGVLPSAPSADALSFAEKEDRLVIALLGTKDWHPALTAAKAREQFTSLADEIARSGKQDPADEAVPTDSCRAGLQAIESIATLAPAQRVQAWRAMVSIQYR